MASPLDKLFKMLARNSETIEQIINGDTQLNTEESLGAFDELNNHNLAFETASGTIRLSSAFQLFLDMSLKTDKTLLSNVDVGGYWRLILHNLSQMNAASTRGDHIDEQQYKRTVIDGIYHLIDAVNFNILQLRSRLDNKFGYVNSITAKRKENEQAIIEAKRLREALNIIDESEIYERLPNDAQLIKIINNDLIQGKSQAQNELLNALSILQELLFGFRKLEGRTRLVKSFKTLYDNNSKYEFELTPLHDFDELPPNLNIISGLELASSPDENNVFTQKDIIDIIQSMTKLESEFKAPKEANNELTVESDTTTTQEDTLTQRMLKEILIKAVKERVTIRLSEQYESLDVKERDTFDLSAYLDSCYAEWLRTPENKAKHFAFTTIGTAHESFMGNFTIDDIEICFRD